jgi:hypothetical protein
MAELHNYISLCLNKKSYDCEETMKREWGLDETLRQRSVLAGDTVVANMKRDKALISWAKKNGLFVRIDRRTKWGNRFELGKDGERDFVIESYALYFERKLSLHSHVAELDGKVLGCWCYPEACHGGELLRVLKEQQMEQEATAARRGTV